MSRRSLRWLNAAEAALDRTVIRLLEGRPGWQLTVDPYVGHGTPTAVHLRARVLLRRAARPTRGTGRRQTLRDALAPYFSVEVHDREVSATLAGGAPARTVHRESDEEGYVDAHVSVPEPGLAPGWHDVAWTLRRAPEAGVSGRVLVVDPEARLGLVSDLDDTVIHTGLTRLRETLRTSLATPAHARDPIPGAAAFYQALVERADGRALVCYVSSGAWNMHSMLESFLDRHDFPAGPLALSDWGPGHGWLFRESSVASKVRAVLDLMAAHPRLRWVLVGDSGQDDPEAYAVVARHHSDRVLAVYIRDVPPTSRSRTERARLAQAELAGLGVPLLLVSDSVVAAEHAASLGLLTDAQVNDVRRAVHAAD